MCMQLLGRGLSRWLLAPAALLAMLLPALGDAADPPPPPPTLNVKVDFDEWKNSGSEEDKAARKAVLDGIQAQLDKDWGRDITDKEDKVVEKGIKINVSDGVPGDKEVGVKINNTAPAGEKSLGSTTLGKKQADVYASNFNTKWLTADLLTAIEKTASHELGHVTCGNDQNERDKVDKMAQTWRRIEASGGDPEKEDPTDEEVKKFTDLNKTMEMSEADRLKMIRNLKKFLENGGKPCDSWFPEDKRTPKDVAVYDDPVGEESGIVQFAITATGDWEHYNLGFLNPGGDGFRGTSDDWWTLKWLGLRDIDGDGANDTAPDGVLTLLNEGVYAFGAIDDLGNVFSLEDYGTLALSSPVFNDIFKTTVYQDFELEFDFDLDGTFDLEFALSSNMPGNLEDFYIPNKPGTGVNTVPEPSILVGLLSIGAMGLVMGWRKKQRAA